MHLHTHIHTGGFCQVASSTSTACLQCKLHSPVHSHIQTHSHVFILVSHIHTLHIPCPPPYNSMCSHKVTHTHTDTVLQGNPSG